MTSEACGSRSTSSACGRGRDVVPSPWRIVVRFQSHVDPCPDFNHGLLVQVAIGMNRGDSREETWSYLHENAEPYWLIAAPAKTEASALDAIEFPENWRSAAKDCVRDGEAVMILAQAATCSCVRPIVVPEIRDPVDL